MMTGRKPRGGTKERQIARRAGKTYNPGFIKKRERVPKDSYLLREPPPEGSICNKCGAVYHRKRWSLAPAAGARTLRGKKVFCPACLKIRDGFPGGIVTLRWKRLADHREDLLNLIRNEEARARGYNPLERIIHIREGRGMVEVETTTEKLAQRIGREVKKAYHGDLSYLWSHDVKLVRVNWQGAEPPLKVGRR